MDSTSRQKPFDFHGVSMISRFTNNWEAIQNFQARPDDILIATYPKAGTTWISYILELLYFGQISEHQDTLPIYERVPFLELAYQKMDSGYKGTELADQLSTSPRIIKTHLPVQFVPKSFWEQNCRMVYVARNAKDNMVSYFHFERMNFAQPEPGDWNSYIQKFLAGKLVFGSWYDHVNGWWKKKEISSNLHYMFYEDLSEDTGREIDKLCSDIVIVTYPKSGTTWVSYILHLLYFGQMSSKRWNYLPIHERVPFLELTYPNMRSGYKGTALADKLPTRPRLIKTHLPVQFVPKSFWEQNCRMVYVARNAKDNVVSSFHFERMNFAHPDPGDWNSYLQKFLAGKMVFGSWYDHVNGWWKTKQNYSNLHYMFYEDLAEDSLREIDKLCSFLGLSPSVEEKIRVMREVKFDKMKNNPVTNYSTNPAMDVKISPFMRKGQVGDWRNHFTLAQNDEFDEDYKKKMKDPTLQFRSELPDELDEAF